MTSIGVPVVTLFAVLVLGPCGGTELAGPVEQDSTALSFASLANAVRVDAGCRDLKWHPGATEVARRHSLDMKEHGFFSYSRNITRVSLSGSGWAS